MEVLVFNLVSFSSCFMYVVSKCVILSLHTQKSDAHTCPYCRCEIKGTESILIEPYRTTGGNAFGRREEDDEEDDDDDDDEDHEDVELVMKKLAAMKRVRVLGLHLNIPY